MSEPTDSGQTDRRAAPSSSGRPRAPRQDLTVDAGALPVTPPRASDSTVSISHATSPTSSDRLARLAAALPRIPRDTYAMGVEVAKGGIGRVLRARDKRLDRAVAIKELLVWTESQERRFMREALLTARLQHPAIVPIYEAGRWPDGEPFYAMKLVSGRTLSELITEAKTLPGRLALLPHVITAAQAIAYAHSERIIHRDLKPANILVGEFGETVVIDWGLAKSVSDEEIAGAAPGDPSAAAEGLTMVGAIVGTPAYMPPEQAAGKPVDERADVYALGAMLYQLITAVPPYHDVPLESLLLRIAVEPPRAVEKLEPAISDELCTIVHKAMARSPAARYRTARELADDLHRFQTGQIVAAHTYSASQLLRRFWRRNRTALSIAAAALALLALVIIGAFVKTDSERRVALESQAKAERAESDARAAQRASEKARRQATSRADEMTLLQAQTALKTDPNEALAWLKTLSPSFSDATEMRRIASDAQAHGISRAYRGHTAAVNKIALLDGNRFVTASDDKTIRIWDLDTGQSRAITGHDDEAWGVAVLADGKRIASVSKDSTMRTWDLTTGAPLTKVTMANAPAQLLVRADGALVGAPEQDGLPWIVPSNGSEARLLGDPTKKMQAWGMSGDARKVVVQYQDGTSVLVDTETGKGRSLGSAPRGRRYFMSTDGRSAVQPLNMVDAKRDLELWDLETGAHRTIRWQGHEPRIAFSHGGQLAALCAEDRIEIYDARSGELKSRLSGHGADVNRAAFSPDDRVLATAGMDRIVRTWDLTTGESHFYSGLKEVPTDIEFLPDGRTFLASSAAGDIRLFAPPTAGRAIYDHKESSSGLTVSAEGRIASTDERGKVVITELDGKLVAEHPSSTKQVPRLLPSPDRRRWAMLATVCIPFVNCSPRQTIGDTTLEIGTFDDKKPLLISMPAAINDAVFHPGGDSVIVSLADGSVQKVTTTGAVSQIDRLPSSAFALAISADGRKVVAGAEDGLVRLIDLETGERHDVGRHDGMVSALAFSNDGTWLASSSLDHTVRLWRLADGSYRSLVVSAAAQQLAFTLDSRTLLAAVVREAHVRRWSVDSGKVLPSLIGHQGWITAFSLSADGRRVLTGSMDRVPLLFDLATGKSRSLVGHSDSVREPSFTPDGKAMVTLGEEGTVRVWPDDLPETVPALREWIEAATPDRVEGLSDPDSAND